MGERMATIIENARASNSLVEAVVAQVFAAVETSRHMAAVPELYAVSPDQVAQPPSGEIGAFVFAHMGDVWEVAALFTATRLALQVVSMSAEALASKNIPDEICFWASMAVGVAIPSMMELGVWEVTQLSSNPGMVFEPADMFGVGIASLVLISTHYLSRKRDRIKDILKGRIAEKS